MACDKLLKTVSCRDSKSTVCQTTELLMCSEKAELDDTKSGPHVGKDSNKGTCEELTVDETMS